LSSFSFEGFEMAIVNVGILKHPLNWLTVAMMLILASVAGGLVLSLFGVEPTTESQ
jgi:hypothetical protein